VNDDAATSPDLDVLTDRSVAIVGYGSQGRAQALNLEETGVDVRVGVRRDGDSWDRAHQDGVPVRPIPEAVEASDVVLLLVPDEVQPTVYERTVRDELEPGDALVFAHGFSLWSGQIEPPGDVDVGLVAPKAPGSGVRSSFQEGTGVPTLVAVDQDASGSACELVRALATGIGAGSDQIVGTTVAEETETDLFGEQAVLCGGLSQLILHGFETLVDAGYQPEVAYFEVVNELKLIVDLVHDGGLEHMWANVSNTAEFGGRSRGPEVVDDQVRANMEGVLERIRSGRFASAWLEERADGLDRLRPQTGGPRIDRVGARIRSIIGSEVPGKGGS
jgi:ketol-acid reductoisomerase